MPNHDGILKVTRALLVTSGENNHERCDLVLFLVMCGALC